MFLVRGLKLYRVPGTQQDRFYDFHGVGADPVAEHVNRNDGKYLRARNRTEREGMDETSKQFHSAMLYTIFSYDNSIVNV